MAADVLPLHRQSQPATNPDQGRGGLRAELVAMRDRLNVLLGQLAIADAAEASAPQRALAVEGPIVTLGKAAGDVGWDEQKARRHIVAHNARNPHDRLGWQAGGLENVRWSIPLDRWRRYVRDLPASPVA